MRTNFTDYDDKPEGMVAYIRNYGPHFNRKLSDFAAEHMELNGGKAIKPFTKQQVEDLLKQNNIRVDNGQLYDCVYVANMCQADYFGSSIIDMKHLAMYIKDTIDDPDGCDGLTFNRFYADCSYKGIAIDWEEML